MDLTPEIVATLPTQPSGHMKGCELLLPMKWEYVSPEKAWLTIPTTPYIERWDRVVGTLTYHPQEPESVGFGWRTRTKEGFVFMDSKDPDYPDKEIPLEVMAQHLIDKHCRTILQYLDTDKL